MAKKRPTSQHWHYWSITRALKRLGAQRIGWGMQHTRDMVRQAAEIVGHFTSNAD